MNGHSWLVTARTIGLMVGIALIAFGGAAGGMGALMRGYGTMLALSAVWMLGGAGMRMALRRRSVASRGKRRSLVATRAR